VSPHQQSVLWALAVFGSMASGRPKRGGVMSGMVLMALMPALAYVGIRVFRRLDERDARRGSKQMPLPLSARPRWWRGSRGW
jgi:hypothetical protein